MILKSERARNSLISTYFQRFLYLIAPMKNWIFISILFLLSISVVGKDSLAVRKKSLFGGFCAASYKGSLSSTYAKWTPAYQIGIRFEKKKRINGMISICFGSVIGEDRNYKVPSGTNSNITPVNKFETTFTGIQYDARILLFHYKSFRFFMSQGLGLMRFTPKDWDGNNLTTRDRTRKQGESYNSTSLMFPTQIAMMVNFQNGMAIGFQAGWVNTLTNYLDNMDQLSSSGNGDNMAMYKVQFFVPLSK